MCLAFGMSAVPSHHSITVPSGSQVCPLVFGYVFAAMAPPALIPLDRALPSRDRQTLYRMGGQFIELPESLLPLLPTTTLLRGLPSVEFSQKGRTGVPYESGRCYIWLGLLT